MRMEKVSCQRQRDANKKSFPYCNVRRLTRSNGGTLATPATWSDIDILAQNHFTLEMRKYLRDSEIDRYEISLRARSSEVAFKSDKEDMDSSARSRTRVKFTPLALNQENRCNLF